MLPVIYQIKEQSGVFVIKSVVRKNGREYRNFVGERDTKEGAENLILKLQRI